MVRTLLLSILLLFSLPLYASYPPELTGNFEIGEKHFDYVFDGENDPLDDDEDSYLYWKGYLRYQQRLKPYSYYYLRYEYQKRDYTLRERYTSELHQLTGNLTYQPSHLFRYYLQMNLRYREYPNSTFTYQAITPSIQLNYYPTDDTTLSLRYQLQHRLYPQREASSYNLQGLVFTFRQKINPSFTINGRLRVDYKEELLAELVGDLEKRFSIGFRYVMD